MAPPSWIAATSSGAQKTKVASGSMNRRTSQAVAVRFTRMRSRVTHFMLSSSGPQRLDDDADDASRDDDERLGSLLQGREHDQGRQEDQRRRNVDDGATSEDE